MEKVIKRDGRKVPFDKVKIQQAILGAMEDVGDVNEDIARRIANDISKLDHDEIDVESIQDLVEEKLMASKMKKVARQYIRYRYDREKTRAINKNLQDRFNEFHSLIEGSNDEANKENSNKDTRIISTMRDYIAGFACKEMAGSFIIPKDLMEGHNQGLYHIHDLDYSPAMPMTNCCLINLEDMLQNGTVISGTLIEKPHSFRTACTITSQISAQVASSQYGGQTISLSHIAPFVDISRQKIRKQVEKEVDMLAHPILQAHKKDTYTETINKIVEDRLKQEIKDGIQTIQYQLITLSSTNGQSPFVSVFMYLNEVEDPQTKADLALLIEETLRQRIQGVKNEQGVYITTAFPKLLYVLEEDNISEDSTYWYLTELAAECSAKRLVPDYISEKKIKELKEGNCFPCMGCRSFLQQYYDENGKPKFYGRFNQGVVTINLPDIALSSNGDFDKFWQIFEERLNDCYRALMIRHNSLLNIKSDVAPILWQHGAYARLKPGETINKLLFNDYSSISLGYAGLYECVKYMTGENQYEGGHDFAIQVMQFMNQACQKWKKETNIGFSLYGSPIESTTYKFAKCLQKRFGIIDGITDKKYITNSYHITPSQNIDAFSKLTYESEFQALSLGGNISYIETPNMEKNIPALLEIIKHIYNTNMYAEINTMTSYCQVCGCTDIHLEDDLQFHCPQCGNTDFNKMNVALRICGYISTNPFNEGRANDVHDRVYHVGMD